MEQVGKLFYKGVHIFQFDVETLDPDKLLNSAILDFYLKYIHHSLLAEDKRNHIDVYNSLFHQTFMLDEAIGNEETTQDINLFDKDFILLPVNMREHWFLTVLCYPRNISRKDHKLTEVPRIVIMDSSINYLKSERTTFVRKLLQFIQNQIPQDSGNADERLILPVDIVPVAQQANDHDCGIFLLSFAEKFIMDNYQQSMQTNNRMSYASDIDLDCFKKRQTIRDLIEALSIESIYHLN